MEYNRIDMEQTVIVFTPIKTITGIMLVQVTRYYACFIWADCQPQGTKLFSSVTSYKKFCYPHDSIKFSCTVSVHFLLVYQTVR